MDLSVFRSAKTGTVCGLPLHKKKTKAFVKKKKKKE